MSEQETVQSVRANLSNGPVRAFRNNVGQGWQGIVVQRTATTITLRNPRPIKFGLCEGSSDLIGWRTLTVTTDMVGSKLAVFVALEGKAKTGATTAEQKAFIAAVKDAGGIAGVFRSVDEAAQLLGVK